MGGHCLELDLVTCGNGTEHAIEMLTEAIDLVAQRRAMDGDYPFDFRTAPREALDKLTLAEPVFPATIDLPPLGDGDNRLRAALRETSPASSSVRFGAARKRRRIAMVAGARLCMRISI